MGAPCSLELLTSLGRVGLPPAAAGRLLSARRARTCSPSRAPHALPLLGWVAGALSPEIAPHELPIGHNHGETMKRPH